MSNVRVRNSLAIVKSVFKFMKKNRKKIPLARLRDIIPDNKSISKYVNLIVDIQSKPRLMAKQNGRTTYIHLENDQPSQDMPLPKYDKNHGKKRNVFSITNDIFSFLKTKTEPIQKSDLKEILSPNLVKKYVDLILYIQSQYQFLIRKKSRYFYIRLSFEKKSKD